MGLEENREINNEKEQAKKKVNDILQNAKQKGKITYGELANELRR